MFMLVADAMKDPSQDLSYSKQELQPTNSSNWTAVNHTKSMVKAQITMVAPISFEFQSVFMCHAIVIHWDVF